MVSHSIRIDFFFVEIVYIFVFNICNPGNSQSNNYVFWISCIQFNQNSCKIRHGMKKWKDIYRSIVANNIMNTFQRVQASSFGALQVILKYEMYPFNSTRRGKNLKARRELWITCQHTKLHLSQRVLQNRLSRFLCRERTLWQLP